MKLLIEANNLLSLLTGSSSDLSGMKERVRRGYEGEYSHHVHDYDKYGAHLQDRSARIQLEGISLKDLRVLDVGCGTGALSLVALEQGASEVVCGDISALMLRKARRKAPADRENLPLCQLDAGALPYTDCSFDAVISGMTFGTLPDQATSFKEMVRITKPGGLVCIGAHGPEHYWEAIDATLRIINKRYVLGYRFEWWPQTEDFIRSLLTKEGLENIQSRRVTWRNEFPDGNAAYDFFASISASWWYARFPPAKAAQDSIKTREFFNRKNINIISDDIVIASGYKPS